MTGIDQRTRREFLELTIAALGPLLIGQGCGEDSGDAAGVANRYADLELPPTRVPLPKILAAYFRGVSSEHVRAIGAFAASAKAAEPARGLGEAWSETVHAVSEAESVEAAVARLDARVVQDFESGKIESLAGWQLARTELHLCSLSYILQV